MKPFIHAKSSAKIFGGKPSDYIEIHQLLDSSKSAIPDNRHRVLTHNSWFIGSVLERVIGVTIINSDGKEVSVREVAERHVLEDYQMKFIPTPQDFIQGMKYEDWMNNGKGKPPPSTKEIRKRRRVKARWSFKEQRDGDNVETESGSATERQAGVGEEIKGVESGTAKGGAGIPAR
jgi:hypothetical protein